MNISRSFDQICQSDLRVQAKAYEEIEPNSSGRPKGEPISQLSVGQVTKFYLHVELKNKKEPAYETNLYVTVPSVLYYVQVSQVLGKTQGLTYVNECLGGKTSSYTRKHSRV